MDCAEKKQLLADYLERTQALAVEVELLLEAVENGIEGNESDHWFRAEQTRIHCEIARLALGTHMSGHGCHMSPV
jgi:hypothetical protein